MGRCGGSTPLGGFSSVYVPGPNWDAARPFEGQAGFREQVRWWKAREAGGEMAEVGELLRDPEPLPHPPILVSWRLPDLTSATTRAAESPLVQTGVLRVETGPGAPTPCA